MHHPAPGQKWSEGLTERKRKKERERGGDYSWGLRIVYSIKYIYFLFTVKMCLFVLFCFVSGLKKDDYFS